MHHLLFVGINNYALSVFNWNFALCVPGQLQEITTASCNIIQYVHYWKWNICKLHYWLKYTIGIQNYWLKYTYILLHTALVGNNNL